MIEERHARFQAPGHGHVVHALDRVIGDEHGGVHAQHLIEKGIRFGCGQVGSDGLRGVIRTMVGGHYGL